MAYWQINMGKTWHFYDCEETHDGKFMITPALCHLYQMSQNSFCQNSYPKSRGGLLYSGARIIRTKMHGNFVPIKQNVWIVHTSKSMGKHTIVWITIVRIKQNVRINQMSHYPGSTYCSIWVLQPVQNFEGFYTYLILLFSTERPLFLWTLVAHVNEPISHKCQCIRSVVPQLETTSTSQPGRLPMYLPWDYIDLSIWPTADVPYGQRSWKTAYTD